MHKFLTVAFVAAIAASAFPATAQTVGSKPSCAPGDPVVWENTNTKVYHLSGDKYYGNTKKGAYACKSAADGSGYHLSGSKSTSKSGSTSSGAMASPDAMTSPEPMSSASPSARHHHRHHRSSSMASPSPSPAAT